MKSPSYDHHPLIYSTVQFFNYEQIFLFSKDIKINSDCEDYKCTKKLSSKLSHFEFDGSCSEFVFDLFSMLVCGYNLDF